jgi:hypothetical protein
VVKASSLLWSEAPEKIGWKGFRRTNTLDYCENSQITDIKCFITLRPGSNVINPFTVVIYEFSYKARVFVRIGLKSFSGTNTLAYYENS